MGARKGLSACVARAKHAQVADGTVEAIPFQLAADWLWDWYYREFDEEQQAAVRLAVERHYGLTG
jgi:hypothetical protein